MASLLSGCASIVKGRKKSVNISTNTGQSVEVDILSSSGVQTFYTPTVVSLKRKNQDITVVVKETPCIRQSTFIVSSDIEPWFFGNIITGGLYGSTTDALTGSMWTYDDNITVPVYTKEECKR